MANQVQGSETILSMLQTDHDIRLVLVDREMDTESLRQACAKQGIPLEEGSTNDLWRMSAIGHTDALALLGREPRGTLEEVFQRGGSIWLLDGVQYPTNLGFGIRTIEVSGADAVVLNISRTHQDRRTIRRSSMRADRFIPVVYSDTTSIINEARKNDFRIIAAEDVGTVEPSSRGMPCRSHSFRSDSVSISLSTRTSRMSWSVWSIERIVSEPCT